MTTYPPLSAEVKERVELYLYSTSWSSWPVIGGTFISSPWQQWLHESGLILRYAYIACLAVDNTTLARLLVWVICSASLALSNSDVNVTKLRVNYQLDEIYFFLILARHVSGLYAHLQEQ